MRTSAPIIVTADHIVTLAEPAGPPAEALVIEAGRIVWLGARADAEALFGPVADRWAFGGATIVPGLVDTHVHLAWLGKARLEVSLSGARSEAEAVARVVASAAPGRTPVEGRGWDQNEWPTQAFPTHGSLSAAFPDRPVVLRRVDGHALWANAAALALGGVDAETADPPGGRIIRDAQGRPTGVLLDEAMGLVTRALPEPDAPTLRLWLERGLAECARVGLTGIHDAGMSAATVEALRALEAEGRLPLRIHVLLDAADPRIEALVDLGPSVGERIAVRGVKLFADGALGSRGAWLCAPYTDAPETCGIPILHGARLRERVARYAGAGFQVGVHAIGDAAARDVLDAFSSVISAGNDRRFRLEHAQIVRPEDRQRMAQLGVLAMMQPTHATSDMAWAGARLGSARLADAYAWRSMLEAGVRLALGSDFPVEEPEPLRGLHAAVTRTDLSGLPPGGWRPEERLTAEEALRGFTVDAAFAGFAEGRRGRLAPGFDADLTILDGNPLTVPPAALGRLRIVATVVAGEVTYRAPEGAT